jgi:signal transduction histidine kinase
MSDNLDDLRHRYLQLQLAGDSLVALAVPGTEQKLVAMLDRARLEPLSNIELSLVAEGSAITCSFHAKPFGDGVALLGCWLPEEHSRVLQQIQDSVEEVLDLNRRVVGQKKEMEVQKTALESALSDLEDSNRGITSLHQELEDKAEVLQRTAEVRSRVVANVSHEFRTPLHSILGLSRLLLDSSEVSTDTRLDDVLFRVRDTGIGIAPEHFERIFAEFGQVDSAIQARVKGTGLRLPLSRRLAELLGGVLTVESEVGHGSSFTLRIPQIHSEVR